ncbi:MAG: dihydroorotase [Thermoleophilia bacterium]|nr:dihydroorotase [Thermoleophilia bacterium]
MDKSPRRPVPRLVCRAFPPDRFLIPDVRLLDPSSGVDLEGSILVEDGVVSQLGASVTAPPGTEILSDLAGCFVFPGFVDSHVHLRTPGYEYKEDLESGSLAAAAGGYVAVVAMANTDPVVDCGPVADWVFAQAADRALVKVGQVGAISKGLRGEELAELRELAESGVVGFSDDGHPVAEADLLLHALRYVRGVNRPLLLHLEDRSLSADAVMHEGKWSARLGLRGMPTVCESGPLAHSLEILRYVWAEERRLRGVMGHGEGEAERTKSVSWMHFQHLSCAESVRLVAQAKQEGLPVSAEVTPMHLLLTEENLCTLDTNLKVNPPLRSEEDRQALVAALADHTIDCVATDHAPHASHEKERPFEEALFGSTGLETAFAALYTGLVVTGMLPLGRLVEAMSTAPCRLLGLDPPRLAEGAPADLCVVNLDQVWEVKPENLYSKSRNSAFMGLELRGKVRLTVVNGTRRFSWSKE